MDKDDKLPTSSKFCYRFSNLFVEIFPKILHVLQSKIYRSVIEEVIKNAREYFLNEGVDEQVLQELKQVCKIYAESV